MTTERRISAIEGALTPTELTVAWLTEAHAHGGVDAMKARSPASQRRLGPPPAGTRLNATIGLPRFDPHLDTEREVRALAAEASGDFEAAVAEAYTSLKAAQTRRQLEDRG